MIPPLRLCAFLAAAGLLATSTHSAESPSNTPNTLTTQEKASGWKLLFDGKTTDGWRAFGKQEMPPRGWIVEGGWLKHTAKGGGGDIITKEQFDDFEFEFEWKVAPGANSGIKYLISESRGPVGHEYQIIDDAAHSDAKRGGKWQSAALYDLIASSDRKKLRPAGEVNHGKIVVLGSRVEHWINGEKVVAAVLESDEMKQLISASKYKAAAQFGTKAQTPILLQDHGDEVWFRNLKIRKLPGVSTAKDPVGK